MSAAARAGAMVMALALSLAPRAQAQSVADRTPNLGNTWIPARGVVQFNLTHRFDVSDAPLRKLTNTPSFQVATGLLGTLGAGFTYGSNSDLVPAYPNEWEWFARWSPLAQGSGAVVDASLQAGWNVASESFDAELNLARQVGPLRLLVAGRAFHNAFYEDSARYALAGGAVVRLTSWLSIAGDYAALLDRTDAERPAWGAGLQLSVPYTPHSLSLHASNVGTGTLEGTSRGSHTRWGFEYTVPITLRRYTPRPTPREAMMTHDSAQSGGTAMMMDAGHTPDTVVITIGQLRYQQEKVTIRAGDVVIWRNTDPLEHSVTSDAGAFDSSLIKPGKEWSFKFTRPGRYPYHCTPHPFMKADIHVQEVMK